MSIINFFSVVVNDFVMTLNSETESVRMRRGIFKLCIELKSYRAIKATSTESSNANSSLPNTYRTTLLDFRLDKSRKLAFLNLSSI